MCVLQAIERAVCNVLGIILSPDFPYIDVVPMSTMSCVCDVLGTASSTDF